MKLVKSSMAWEIIKNDISNLNLIDHAASRNPLITFDYSRKDFHTATLLQGGYQLEFEDRRKDIAGNTLLS